MRKTAGESFYNRTTFWVFRSFKSDVGVVGGVKGAKRERKVA